MNSIYKQMIEAGVEVDSHESDMYVPVNDVTRQIVADYEYTGNCTTFNSELDGTLWYDIPFSYDPWYEHKLGAGWTGYTPAQSGNV